MRRQLSVAILFVMAQLLAVSLSPRVLAQDAPQANTATQAQDAALDSADTAPPSSAASSVAEQPTPPAEAPAAIEPSAVPSAVPALTADAVPADPVVTAIRGKLSDQAVVKDANANDVAALVAFYGARTGAPLWVTDMGFTARAQSALFEIEKAEDWGLSVSAFTLPSAGALPRSADEQAKAEIDLDLAILKYARHARGGRYNPLEVSKLYDLSPPVRDPGAVLAEISTSSTPDAYLRSLHPKHEQFQLLHQALLKARGKSGEQEEGAKPTASDKDIKRIIINMERWRWMPEDLGQVYVWNNSPEFMLYVVKDGKRIYADKTLVGTSAYATPVFSADLKTVVFNPDWVAPPTVVTENLLPPLASGSYSILRVHGLSVSLNGRPVDPSRVSWNRSNILGYTFSQRGGPENVLGKAKFLFPNRHTVYMHDTLPVRKKYFSKTQRMIGHECVRMEKPDKFASVLLAEDKGWGVDKVKSLWDGWNSSSVSIEHKIPVHMVYFTAVADESGKVATFGDVYGLDRRLAAVMFGNSNGFTEPPPDTTVPEETTASVPAGTAKRATTSNNDIAGSLGGFAGD
jgi:murein L,D-transpeptidase YcbB/YkuD